MIYGKVGLLYLNQTKEKKMGGNQKTSHETALRVVNNEAKKTVDHVLWYYYSAIALTFVLDFESEHDLDFFFEVLIRKPQVTNKCE